MWLVKMETNNYFNIDKFQLYGDEGLNIYYNWINTKSRYDENYTYEILANLDKYSCYDVMQIKHFNEDYTDTTTSYIEIKTRDISIFEYDDCVIDSYKIFNLQKLSAATNNKCFLCAIYKGDNKIALWEINPRKRYQTIAKNVNWHTANLADGKKTKEMVALPLKEAKIYNYQMN